MKLEPAHIDHIRIAFEQMQTKDDLLQLLNEVKPVIYGENTVPFELKQLTWYANPKLAKKRYTQFSIKKKSGADRSIHAPVKGLKAIQKTLSFIIQCVFEPHQSAMGFVRDKSIVDNATLHASSKYVYNIDLKDFFSSIDQARVWKCLQLKPFNLSDDYISSQIQLPKTAQKKIRMFVTDHNEKIYYSLHEGTISLIGDKNGNFKKYRTRITQHIVKPNLPPLSTNKVDIQNRLSYQQKVNEAILADVKKYITLVNNDPSLSHKKTARRNLANIIASLCCTEMEVERKNNAGEWEKVKRNVLPQGAPTSPVITNIVCQRLDYLLTGVAKRFGLKYSRYADDITFSSMHNIYQPESEFLKELHRIIAEQNFHIKESKTRLQKDGYRKEVTGLLVNEKVNVQKRYIKQLRMWLYYWEQYGYERASEFFLQQYFSDKGHVKNGKPEMANVIAGKLDYLKMVKGADNKLYMKLKERFDALTQINNEQDNGITYIALDDNFYDTTIITQTIETHQNKETFVGKQGSLASKSRAAMKAAGILPEVTQPVPGSLASRSRAAKNASGDTVTQNNPVQKNTAPKGSIREMAHREKEVLTELGKEKTGQKLTLREQLAADKNKFKKANVIDDNVIANILDQEQSLNSSITIKPKEEAAVGKTASTPSTPSSSSPSVELDKLTDEEVKDIILNKQANEVQYEEYEEIEGFPDYLRLKFSTYIGKEKIYFLIGRSKESLQPNIVVKLDPSDPDIYGVPLFIKDKSGDFWKNEWKKNFSDGFFNTEIGRTKIRIVRPVKVEASVTENNVINKVETIPVSEPISSSNKKHKEESIVGKNPPKASTSPSVELDKLTDEEIKDIILNKQANEVWYEDFEEIEGFPDYIRLRLSTYIGKDKIYFTRSYPKDGLDKDLAPKQDPSEPDEYIDLLLIKENNKHPLWKSMWLKNFISDYWRTDEGKGKMKIIRPVKVEASVTEKNVMNNLKTPIYYDIIQYIEGDVTSNQNGAIVPEPLNSRNYIKMNPRNPLPRIYYYPAGLYKFLFAYNQDPILKSTCHLIDINMLDKIIEYCETTEYNFDIHYSKILESYNKIEQLFAPKYIKALIRGYLTGKKYSGEDLIFGWSDYKIEWHWGHKVLRDWCDKNKNIPPNPDEGIAEKFENIGFKFDRPVKIKENHLQSFSSLVIEFKKMFHIREDNSLLKIIKIQNEQKKWSNKIDFQIENTFFPENIEFFTDIDKLLQAYNEFISLIIKFQRDEKPKVKLSLIEKVNSINFSIHHINGFYGKSLESSKSRLIGTEYEGIIDKLNGICNIFLQANFGQNDFARLAIWDENWNIQPERKILQLLENFDGVEHILEFKRK